MTNKEIEIMGNRKWVGGFVFGLVAGGVVAFLATLTWVVNLIN